MPDPVARGSTNNLLDVKVLQCQRLQFAVSPTLASDGEFPVPFPVAPLGMLIAESFHAVDKYRFKRGRGCLVCRQTGYVGRDGIFEVLPITSKLRGLIARQAGSAEVFTAIRQWKDREYD